MTATDLAAPVPADRTMKAWSGAVGGLRHTHPSGAGLRVYEVH